MTALKISQPIYFFFRFRGNLALRRAAFALRSLVMLPSI